MIRFPVEYLAFIYVMVLLAGVLLVWIPSEVMRSRRRAGALRRRIHCGLCAMDYRDSSQDPLPHCPRCARRNEREFKIF